MIYFPCFQAVAKNKENLLTMDRSAFHKLAGVKEMMNCHSHSLDPPLVTIVTVTLNCEEVVSATLESVVSQDYDKVEHIVVDGKSKDDTVRIINNYRKFIDQFISEKDGGIYDAMNKGVRLASSESCFITFLNAGDVFHDRSVISNIVKSAGQGWGHIYGNIIRNGQLLRTPDKINEFILATNMICHQAFFFRTDVHRQYLYDTRFKFCADYKLLIELVRAGEKFCKVNLPIVDFDDSGLSSQWRKKLKDEKREIRKEYPKLLFYYWCKRIYRSI